MVIAATEAVQGALDEDSLLEVKGLKVHLRNRGQVVRAVDGVDLEVRRGEVVGLVGESGSGKSMTARGIMRLLPSGLIHRLAGSVVFEGTDVLEMSRDQLQEVRGAGIGMVFQDPMTYLNPTITVGRQLIEPIRLHRPGENDPEQIVAEALVSVGLDPDSGITSKYAHQLSGGMRQRVLIAAALVASPRLLIADEPTTALDVTVQAQILRTLQRISESRRMAILLVTHDLGIVAQLCDRVAVMYAGQIVESAPTRQLLSSPQHPYTEGLLRCVRSIDTGEDELYTISGSVPDLREVQEGCRFRERCGVAFDRCSKPPPTFSVNSGHWSRCWLGSSDG